MISIYIKMYRFIGILLNTFRISWWERHYSFNPFGCAFDIISRKPLLCIWCERNKITYNICSPHLKYKFRNRLHILNTKYDKLIDLLWVEQYILISNSWATLCLHHYVLSIHDPLLLCYSFWRYFRDTPLNRNKPYDVTQWLLSSVTVWKLNASPLICHSQLPGHVRQHTHSVPFGNLLLIISRFRHKITIDHSRKKISP